MQLILASNSPRRKELLSKLGYDFVVQSPTCSEVSTARIPQDAATEIASRKAADVFRKSPDAVVIGSDTVVVYNNTIFGKPTSLSDAVSMLKELSGNTHTVYTGVCVMCKEGVWLFAEATRVAFHCLTDEQIEQYVSTGSPMDKAGAYGIQDSGFVKAIEGEYNNVVGFPSSKIKQVLQQIYKR